MSAAPPKLRATDLRLIESLVEHYRENIHFFKVVLSQLLPAIESSADLMRSVHSLRSRVKDPEHLRDKLTRKMVKAKAEGSEFSITKDNLFESINDLAGVRILHLHTDQIVEIDARLNELFEAYRYGVIESAKARTWDDEYRQYYDSVGISTVDSPKMYTSVHYVISPNMNDKFTCELQVRTLAEELWGEVDHSMNYPHESKIEACRTQIKVLARVTSSCSRLVDSIFQTSRAIHVSSSVPTSNSNAGVGASKTEGKKRKAAKSG